MITPQYDDDKYYRIIDRTQSNYANQLKRLSGDSNRISFIMIYYSIFLIINALIQVLYTSLFDELWLSFSSIILSVVVLIVSIINQNANYQNRITKLQDALNFVKSIKREYGMARDDQTKKEKLKERYEEIVNQSEVRDDMDFFQTIVQLCKRYHISLLTGKEKGARDKDNEIVITEIQGYISEISPLRQIIHICGTKVLHVSIYIIPIVILALGVYFKIC